MSEDLFTIVVDSREQKPFEFERYPVKTVTKTMKTADYAVQQPGYYGKNGTYKAPFGVERKGESDFLSSITHDRERFKREIKRASEWDAPMPVVIESPYVKFKQGNYYPNINPNSIIGTVDKWPKYYNVDFFFRDDRRDAESFTFEMLRWWNNQS